MSINNELGKLIYIDHYGSALVAQKGNPWTGRGKWNKNHNTKKWTKYKSNIDKVKNTQCSLYYDTYIIWGTKSGSKQKWKKRNYEKYAKGFLSTLSGTYGTPDVKWKNTWVCDSATDVATILANNGGKKFKTPSSVEFSFQDIDVEIDDETKKKTVVDVGRGQTGYLTRNRVRDNVIKIEVEWSFLTPDELSTLLSALSQHGKTASQVKAYQWIWVCFLNPYTNAISTKKMYVGDRTVSATYKGNYTNLKVSLVEY